MKEWLIMLKIYGGCSKEIVKKANEKLSDFIDFQYDLLISGNDSLEEKKEVLSLFFPELIVEEKTEKCLQTMKELYFWVNDSYMHTLTPIHEYALYQILEQIKDLIEDEEDNPYEIQEYQPKREDEENIGFTIEDTNVLEFYYSNCFLDHDFLDVAEYTNNLEENGPELLEMLGFDIVQYQDLIPTDIIECNKQLKRLLDKGTNEDSKGLFNLSKAEFFKHINKLASLFQHAVINHSLYKLLWNDDGTPRNEDSAQRLFLNNIYTYCDTYEIDVSKEPNIGRGPVDFKLSHGALKVLVEVKLASNSAFWHGLEVQTVQYMTSESVKYAIFLVIVYEEMEFEKIKEIENKIKKLNSEYSIEIVAHIIDATKNKPSASKLPNEESIVNSDKIGEF